MIKNSLKYLITKGVDPWMGSRCLQTLTLLGIQISNRGEYIERAHTSGCEVLIMQQINPKSHLLSNT